MKALLERANLSLVDVSIVPIHGKSYLWEVQKGETNNSQLPREAEEAKFGLYDHKLYADFATLAIKKSEEINTLIRKYRDKDFKIVSYGAAAKGNTFINFADITFDYILDDTPQKIGRMAPAGGCIVSHPSILESLTGPLLVVIPAWNFEQEIIMKIRSLRKNLDDVFLTYFPETRLEEANKNH
jgi:hypothetical protein